MKRNDGERDNLFDNIYLSLRQDILWLRLKPGTILTEAYLADKFQSSKTPVREALMRLSFDGLVNVFPRRGYCVSEISFADIKDMHEYRWVLESTCLAKAMEVRDGGADREARQPFVHGQAFFTATRSRVSRARRRRSRATASSTYTSRR